MTINGGYVIHTFYGSGTFTTSSPLTIDAIIVAGGGGGGAEHAGGGGAGGVLTLNGISVNGSYTITVGAGGAGGTSSSWHGAMGGDSAAFGYTASGGGYGSNVYGGPASMGGSGGGYGYNDPTLGAAGTAGQGYSGNKASTGSPPFNGGGGGGAGGAGNGVIGGAALNTWAGTFAGGGGGGFAGGAGGVGAGGIYAGAGAGGNGTAPGGNAANNTGSGGGGGGNMSNPGGSGGSGIVVIRYPLTRTLTLTPPSAPVYPGQNASFTVMASTTAPDSEVVGFLHIDVSTNGGGTWTQYSWEGGIPGLGKSYTKAVNVTAGAAGSVVKVRARAAYRFGAAGDVDYTGGALNWGGWDTWQTPPAKDVSITVATLVKSDQTGVAGSLGGSSVIFPATTTVTASGGQSTGVYEFRQNGGTGAVNFSGSGTTRTITPTTAGTAAIEVRKLGDSSYNDSGWVSAGTLTINQGTQAALTAFASPSPQNFPLTAALSTSGGSGGGAVTYAIVSGPGTISGSTLTPTAVGTVVFTATKAADVNYNAITSANTSIVINPGTQTGVAGSLGAGSVTFPNTTTVTASGGQSTGAYEFRQNGGTGAVSFSGSGASRTLAPDAAGTAVIEVRKLNDSNYSTSNWVSAGALTINQATQTGVAGSLGAGSVTFPNTTTVTASGGQSTGAYEFRQSGGTGAVTFSGSGTSRTISPTTAGTAVIEIRKLGNVNYTDSAWVGAGTLTIAKAIQAPLSASATPSTLAFGTSATLSSSGGTGSGAVTYAVVSGPATISGSTLTPTGVGTVIFTATKAADANYNAITSAGANVVINPGTQTGVGGSLSASSVYLSGTATVTASGGQSSGAYEFRQSGGTGTVSFSGSGSSRTITPVSVGTAPIEVRRLGDGNYTDSSWVAAGTLTITSAPPATGGTQSTNGAYTIHTFTSGGTFTVNTSLTVDFMIVAGGGGGGAQHAGGGGAGGMVTQNGVTLPAGSYSITIGAGGNGCPVYGTYSGWSGQDGGDSTAFNQVARGGGAGGGMNGNNGGCGGGANGSAVNGAPGAGGIGSQGGNGGFNAADGVAGGGGGGLAGSANASSGGSAITNWAGTFGGGGGGGYIHGAGGGAGAGDGGDHSGAGGNALANTGSGGGGGGNNSAAGGNGGSGIVVIRYLSVQKAPATVTLTPATLSQTYDGSPRVVAATAKDTATNASISVQIDLTYNGSLVAPTGAGTYTVVGTVNDANYQGSVSGTLTVTVPSSTTAIWKPENDSWSNSTPPPNPSADGTWSYRYDTLSLDALAHAGSTTWSPNASDSQLAKLATQTQKIPSAWWNTTAHVFTDNPSISEDLALVLKYNQLKPKAPTSTTTSSAYQLNADGLNPILAFRAPVGGTNDYSVKASIVKLGSDTDVQDFGDGVLVEVFKVEHSQSEKVTRLWSTLLARANSSDAAQVNLVTRLNFGDEIYFRASSHTTNGTYDLVVITPTVKMANVKTYSVAASAGTSSNTATINACIAEAQGWLDADLTRDRAVIELAEGVHYLDDAPVDPATGYIDFSHRSNITLRGLGTGAALVAKDFKRSFVRVADDSANISMENLVFDYLEAALPFVQATINSAGVTANSNGTWHVAATMAWKPAVTSDFDGHSGLFSQAFAAGASDPALAKATADAFSADNIALNNYQIEFNVPASVSLAAGDVVIIRNIPNPPEGALTFYKSTDCDLTDVTVRAASNLTIWAIDVNGLHLNRYKVERSQTFVGGVWSGPSRRISANKDGVHFQGSRRGPSIESSSFDGLGDDGVNVHGEIEPIGTVNSSTQITVTSRNRIKKGDVIVVAHATTGYSSPTHLKVDGDPSNNPASGTWVVNLAATTAGAPATLPTGANYFVNASSSAEGFIIRNSRFTHIRPRANLIQTGFGLITENYYDTCSQAGLTFNTDLAVSSPQPNGEGPYPRNIVTRFNYFGNGLGYFGSSPLKVWWTCPGGSSGDITNLKQPSASVVDAPIFQGVLDQITDNKNLGSDAGGVGYLPGSLNPNRNQ